MVSRFLGSISFSAVLSCVVYSPLRGRSAGSYPEQRLVIEPIGFLSGHFKIVILSFHADNNIRALDLSGIRILR